MDEEIAAQNAAAEVAEAVAAPVAEAIAGAAEAQAEAEETAEQIAAAAMESARGQRIESVERELAACQNSLMDLGATLETLPSLMATETLALLEPMNSRLSVLEAALESLTLAAPKPLTPPPSMGEVPAVIVEPEETPPAPPWTKAPRKWPKSGSDLCRNFDCCLDRRPVDSIQVNRSSRVCIECRSE